MSDEIERGQDYKRRKREQAAETYEERRAHALAHGTRCLYLVCPTCGQNRVLHQHFAGESRFIEFDPERPLIQTRIGGGKMPGGAGVGFFTLEEESYNLEQVREFYPEIYEHLVDCVSYLAGILGISTSLIEEAEELEEEIEEEDEEREEEIDEVEDVAVEVDMEGEEIGPPPVEIGYPYRWREQIVYLHRLYPQLTYSAIAERVGCTEDYVGRIVRRWEMEGVWWPQP